MADLDHRLATLEREVLALREALSATERRLQQLIDFLPRELGRVREQAVARMHLEESLRHHGL